MNLKKPRLSLETSIEQQTALCKSGLENSRPGRGRKTIREKRGGGQRGCETAGNHGMMKAGKTTRRRTGRKACGF